jgi:transcriptional regulator with XRE-family HTH domain
MAIFFKKGEYKMNDLYYFANQLRLWRRANRIKQHALALDLGVTQAAVSRWESGIDRPSPLVMNRLNAIMTPIDLGLRLDMQLVERQAGVRGIFDCDRYRLLTSSLGMKRVWPVLCNQIDYDFADDVINELAPTVSDHALNQQLVRGEIVLMSGVSERHLALDVDEAFHHRWHICFKRSGTRLLADMIFEPCSADIPVGITDIVTLDALMSREP